MFEGLHLLLVEDEPAVLRGISRVMRNFGFAVSESTGNTGALRILHAQEIDVVISDQNRPDGTGLELFATMRSDERTQEIPFILVSGNMHGGVELRAWRSYVDAVLWKPATTEEIVRALNHALRRRSNPDHALLDLGTETRDLDYKASLELSTTTARAELARDVLGMANSGGGTIVVGVEEISRVRLHGNDILHA